MQDSEIIRDNVDWKRLSGARVLITGGTGFVGSWMQIAPGVNVTALNQLQYEYGKWDYADWDYIIHLVPPPVTTERVIACAKRCNAAVLFSSSGAVYDAVMGDYAKSKLNEETRLIESGIDAKIARMYAFAGAHMPNRFALINYIWDAIGGGPIKIRGDNVIRSYLYAADMAVWLWNILLNGRAGAIYEVGSEMPVTMERLAWEVGRHFAPIPDVIYERMYGPDPRPRYLPESTRDMMHELGLHEYTGFTEAIAKTVDWYKGEVEL